MNYLLSLVSPAPCVTSAWSLLDFWCVSFKGLWSPWGKRPWLIPMVTTQSMVNIAKWKEFSKCLLNYDWINMDHQGSLNTWLSILTRERPSSLFLKTAEREQTEKGSGAALRMLLTLGLVLVVYISTCIRDIRDHKLTPLWRWKDYFK